MQIAQMFSDELYYRMIVYFFLQTCVVLLDFSLRKWHNHSENPKIFACGAKNDILNRYIPGLWKIGQPGGMGNGLDIAIRAPLPA